MKENITPDEKEPPSKSKEDDWSNYKWQLKNAITNFNQLNGFSNKEAEKVLSECGNIPLRITPYYFEVAKKSPALLRTIIPSVLEGNTTPDEAGDPLCEKSQSPLPNVVHRYPDRVLFLATGTCSTNCRYCTRSRMVGKKESIYGKTWWNKAFDYIKHHKEIRDVIVSGGDPLTLPDSSIEYILKSLRSIKHIEIIRIGTKVPVVLPMRITTNLVKIIKKYHPVYINIHFTHPDEITSEVEIACDKLVMSGAILGSQSVLLKGINDNPETMKKLMHGLVKIGVVPRYIYQCDKVAGTTHFRTDVQTGIDIIRKLQGYTSGFSVPKYVIDTNMGKIPVNPEYITKLEDGKLLLKNYEGKTMEYII